MNFYFLWSPARSYQRLQTISSSNLSVPPAFSIPGRRERWVGGGRSLEKTSAGFKALIGGFVISFWALGCPINAFMSPALKDMTLDFSISCSSLTFGSRLSLFLLSRDLRSVEQESKKSKLRLSGQGQFLVFCYFILAVTTEPTHLFQDLSLHAGSTG